MSTREAFIKVHEAGETRWICPDQPLPPVQQQQEPSLRVFQAMAMQQHGGHGNLLAPEEAQEIRTRQIAAQQALLRANTCG